MSMRYRPSAQVILICLLMLVLLAMQLLFIQPAHDDAEMRLASLEKSTQDITLQLQQKPSDDDRQMLARASWTGPDWTQATIDAMDAAKMRVQGLDATYALGSPSEANLAGDDYAVQRLDLEIKSQSDPAIFAFIDSLQQQLPGVSAVTTLQMQKDQREGTITATLSIALYRLVRP